MAGHMAALSSYTRHASSLLRKIYMVYAIILAERVVRIFFLTRRDHRFSVIGSASRCRAPGGVAPSGRLSLRPTRRGMTAADRVAPLPQIEQRTANPLTRRD